VGWVEVFQLTAFGLFVFGVLFQYLRLRRSDPGDQEAIAACAAEQGLDLLSVRRSSMEWRFPFLLFAMSNVARVYDVEAKREGAPANFTVAIDSWPGCKPFRVLSPPR
jgi:hypothetical protein